MQRPIWDRVVHGLSRRCGAAARWIRECGTSFDSQNGSPYKQPGESGTKVDLAVNIASARLDVALQVQDRTAYGGRGSVSAARAPRRRRLTLMNCIRMQAKSKMLSSRLDRQ